MEFLDGIQMDQKSNQNQNFVLKFCKYTYKYSYNKCNTSEPHYFGLYFKGIGGCNCGDAAFVLSNRTLKYFYYLLKDSQKYTPKDPNEDLAVELCLKNASIKSFPCDTRDKYQKETVHPLKPIDDFYLPASSWPRGHDRWENGDEKDIALITLFLFTIFRIKICTSWIT